VCCVHSVIFIICRPGKPGSTATGRGVLSLSGLSHGVVRVDKEGSLTSLTLQDCGTVLPGGKPALLVSINLTGFCNFRLQ